MSRNIISNVAQKFISTGMGALSITEKLPKDVVAYLLDQLSKQKDELIKAIAKEVAVFLSKVKVQDEIQKALTQLELHVEANVTFSPKHKKGKSTPVVSVNIKN